MYKRHKSGIGMKRWERLLGHLRKGKLRDKDGIVANINNARHC